MTTRPLALVCSSYLVVLLLTDPSVVTPAGVSYYTPRPVISETTPDGGGDNIITSQIDYGTRDGESLPPTSFRAIQSFDLWATFMLYTRHHYHIIASTTFISVTFEHILKFEEQDLATGRHPHQNAGHGIICRGSFSEEDTTTRFLWQAHNLMVELAKIILDTGKNLEPMRPSHYTQLCKMLYWISPQSAESWSSSKTKLLLETVENSSLCQSLLGFDSRGMPRWLGVWQQMTSEEGTRTEELGCLCFGDPAVPHPEMEIITILVRAEDTDSTIDPSLLRICLWVDSAEERRDCCYCHNNGMILDFVNAGGAVKSNVPLFGANNLGPIFDWAHFNDCHQTAIEHGFYTWKELEYKFQGTAQILHVCSAHEKTSVGSEVHVIEDLNTRFARERRPNGNMCYEVFDSFPLDTTSWFCSVSGGIHSIRKAFWDLGWHSGLFNNNIVFERRSVS